MRRASADAALQKALELAHGAGSEAELLRKATHAQVGDSVATQ